MYVVQKFSKHSYLAVAESKGARQAELVTDLIPAHLPEISALLGVIIVCIPVSLKQVQACAGQVYIHALEQNRTSEEHTFYSDQEGQYKEMFSPEKCFQGQLYSKFDRHLHFSTQVVNIELQC